MALATAADVAKALGRPLTEDEQEQVESQLDEASDLVLGYLKCPPATPTPDAVVRVVASVVGAVIDRPTTAPPNAASVSAGPYAQTYVEGSTSTGPWLTSTQKMRLARYRCSMVSVPLVSERL